MEKTIFAVTTTVPGFVTSAEIISKLREEFHGVTYDVSTPTGMAKAVDARRKLRDARVSLDKKKPEVKREALDFCNKVEADYKMLRAAVSEYEDVADAAIKAEENRKEEERQEKLRQAAAAQKILDDKIIEIGKFTLLCIGKDSEWIGKFLAAIKAKEIGGEFTGDTRERAENAKAVAIAEIISILGDTIHAEEKAAQLKAEQEAEAARLEEERAERERLDAIRKQEIEQQEAKLAELKRQNELEAARLKALAEEDQRKLAAQRAAFEDEQAKIREEQETAQRSIREKEEAAAAELKRQQDEEAEKQRELDRIAAVNAEKLRLEAEKERKAAEKARKLAEAKCKDAATAFRKILSICQNTEVAHAQAREEIALIAEGNL